MRVGKKLTDILEATGFLAAGGLIVYVLGIGSRNLGYNWQWYRVPQYLVQTAAEGSFPGLLLRGLVVTLEISGLGLVASFLIGLMIALFRLSRSFTARLLARIYLEAVRNTPLLIQLFFMYFVLAPILGIGPFVSAVLALSLFEGAYASEIIRGGIVSIHKSQWESAYSLGIGSVDTYRYIILPQALRSILPALTGQAVSLVKDSSLVSTIAIYDLTMRGQAIVSRTFLTFEIWFTVAVIYLILTISLSSASRILEKRFKGQTL